MEVEPLRRRRRLSFLIRIWVRDEDARLWTGEVAELANRNRGCPVHELSDITDFVSGVLDEQLAPAAPPSPPQHRPEGGG